MSQLLDLDDLILAVRSPEARAHIGDAVICYRSGALRPSVVALWTATAFDIIGKIRELELTGDSKAQAFMVKFEQVRASNDLKASLDLERTLLEEARDTFELLTHQEFADLDRLRLDRHRCAHPAMNTADDPYQPTAELVRYHLRSAVTHLLAHPPVQGKAALSRLHQEVESTLFPTTVEAALRVLRGGPLQRPKPSLLKDFVLSTLRAVLLDPVKGADGAFVDRAVAALLAAAQLHPRGVAEIYAASVARVLKAVKDEHLDRVVALGARLDEVWTHMPDEIRAKVEQLLETAPAKVSIALFRNALATPALRSHAEARVRGLSMADLSALIEARLGAVSTPAVLSRALDILSSSMSFDMANTTIRRVLLPLAAVSTEEDFARLVSIAEENVEVEHAFETYALFEAIRDVGEITHSRFRDIVERSALGRRYKELANQRLVEADASEDEHGVADQPSGYPLPPHELTVGRRVRHPKFGIGTIVSAAGAGHNRKVRVSFDDESVGQKALISTVARLTTAD